MLNSRSSKNAMTLSEVLMCVGVIGLIAAFTLPVLHRIIPTREDSFKKKADYTIQQVVTQLYDDEAMYPRRSDFYAQGFQNLEKVTINSVDYGGNIKGNASEQKKAKEKFCRLFASKFIISSTSDLKCENDIAESSTSNSVTYARGKKSFTSKDNIDWYLPVTDFQNGAAEIMIDVNGTDLPNCISGTNGCVKPDRFLYYVLPNGTITYEKPLNTKKNEFDIHVRQVTEGCSENDATCNATGGSYEIAKVKDNGALEAFSSDSSKYKGLASKTTYIIKAKPKKDYYTSWSVNPAVSAPARKIKVYNSDVYVDLKFYKRSKYCVTIDYVNCDKEDVTQCATAKIASGCNYKKVANKNGDYKLNDDGSFEFVGQGVDGGEYNYECNGSSTTFNKKGHPIRNASTGAVTADTSYQAVYTCDLLTGDYQLDVTPKSGYTLLPNNNYKQDIRMGTEDITLEISLSR